MDNDINSFEKTAIKLTSSIDNLNDTLQKSMSTKRQLSQRLLMGLAYGIGTVLALSVFIPVVIFLLGKLEWVPLIGDFVQNIINHLKVSR